MRVMPFELFGIVQLHKKLDDLITRCEVPLQPALLRSHQCHFGAIDAVEVAMQPSYWA
jgi:hypothetical protein